jgi:hypothetical protein
MVQIGTILCILLETSSIKFHENASKQFLNTFVGTDVGGLSERNS